MSAKKNLLALPHLREKQLKPEVRGKSKHPFTILMDVSDDGRSEGASRDGHKNLAGGSSPDAVVNGTPRSDGGKQEHQIILASQLLRRRDVTAQPRQNLTRRKTFNIRIRFNSLKVFVKYVVVSAA